VILEATVGVACLQVSVLGMEMCEFENDKEIYS